MQMIVNYSTTEKRYAILEGEKVSKLFIDQPNQSSLVGNIYLGIVSKVLPGMNAVFVDIGGEQHGFLHRDKLASFVEATESTEFKEKKPLSSFVHQGERLLVQVDKDATGTKGPRLTGIVELSGEALIYMPSAGFVATSQKMANQTLRDELKAFGESLISGREGIIFRTNSQALSQEQLAGELQTLRETYEEVKQQASSSKAPSLIFAKDAFLNQLSEELNVFSRGVITVDDVKIKKRLETIISQKRQNHNFEVIYYQGKENIFSTMKVEHELEKTMKTKVWLKSGAYLVIDETEALTVIDVNSGKFVGKANRQMTAFQVNQEAAMEAARQIILRNLAGIILIDFIDMKQESEQKAVIDTLSIKFKTDPNKTKIIGFTELGILQLTRKKTMPSLAEMSTVKCSVCEGTGKVSSAESIAFRLERELWEYRHSDYQDAFVTISEDVFLFFNGQQEVHKKRLEETIGLNIHFQCERTEKPFYKITKLS